MTDLAVQGTAIQGAVDLACTLNPDPCSTAEARLASASLRAWTAGHRLDPSSLTDTAQPFYKLAPAWVGYPFRPGALAPSARGYAPAASAQIAAAARQGPAPASATASSRAAGELAFLDDKSLSIEDKLFRFMALMLQKADKELIQKMKEYEAKKKAQEAKEKSGDGGGGGGILGAIGDALGGIGDIVTGAAKSLAKDLGGPVLAAICTGAGLPQLAPIAMKLGGDIAALAVETSAAAFRLPTQAALGVARQLENAAQGQGTSSRSSAQSGSTSAEGFDERLEMLKLQRLVDKQNTMFSALSNVLKSMHDAQMTAVGNIR